MLKSRTSNEIEKAQSSSVSPKEEVAVQTSSAKGLQAVKQNVGLKSLPILQSNSVIKMKLLKKQLLRTRE